MAIYFKDKAFFCCSWPQVPGIVMYLLRAHKIASWEPLLSVLKNFSFFHYHEISELRIVIQNLNPLLVLLPKFNQNYSVTTGTPLLHNKPFPSTIWSFHLCLYICRGFACYPDEEQKALESWLRSISLQGPCTYCTSAQPPCPFTPTPSVCSGYSSHGLTALTVTFSRTLCAGC